MTEWVLIIAILTSSGFVSVKTSTKFDSEYLCSKKVKLINHDPWHNHPEFRAYCKEDK